MDMIPKVYFINLKHREDRLKSIREELEYMGLWEKAERIEGPIIRAHGSGCAGIAHSLVVALRKAKKEKLDCVLVLQDDCKFLVNRESFEDHLSRFFKDPPSKWAGVWIGSLYQFLCDGTERVYAKPSFLVHDTAILFHSRAYDDFIEYYSMCRDKYMETGEGQYNTDQIVNMRDKIPFSERDNIYVIKEKLCTQADCYSDRTFDTMYGGSMIQLSETAVERHGV